MATRSAGKPAETRALVANEAARLMAEDGIRDFGLAKRKAAQRLRVFDARVLPRNDEIESALLAYQRLFRSDRQPHQLRALRATAVQAMTFLAKFNPRLVGEVLTGTADTNAVVSLHLFADTPEEVTLFLMEHGVPNELLDRRTRIAGDEYVNLPVYRFLAEDTPVELVVFHGRARRQQPLSAVDGRAMARANIARVRDLVDEGAQA